jgi:hypothetical protein
MWQASASAAAEFGGFAAELKTKSSSSDGNISGVRNGKLIRKGDVLERFAISVWCTGSSSSSRSVVAFKGIAVPAAKSLSVCSRRDDDDDDDVDIVQRGRRRRESSVQATAADAVKLDVSKATGSDSHNCEELSWMLA